MVNIICAVSLILLSIYIIIINILNRNEKKRSKVFFIVSGTIMIILGICILYSKILLELKVRENALTVNIENKKVEITDVKKENSIIMSDNADKEQRKNIDNSSSDKKDLEDKINEIIEETETVANED